MTIIKEIKKDNVFLKIYCDEDCESPRKWDNLGTMVCWHRRHDLGDKHNYFSPDDFWCVLAEEITNKPMDQVSLEQCQKIVQDNAIVLPLYLYDHSMLLMSTTNFVGRAHHAEWDSGQVGYIYVTKEKVRKEYDVKHVTQKVRDRVVAILKTEVEMYSQWLGNDVYSFVISDAKGNEINSCWGFFGTDWKENGMVDHIPNEYLFLLEEVV